MHLIEIVPFMSLLLTVRDHTGIGLLAVRNRGGRGEKEHDQPEDDARRGKRQFRSDPCEPPMLSRVSYHLDLR